MNPRFLAIASDPAIIHGVHGYCDEWCDYCPVTARCLAFRCINEFREQHGRAGSDLPFESLEEAVAFTRELAAIEGRSTDEMDAQLAGHGGRPGMTTTDSLASVAWEYAVRASELMMPTADAIASASRGVSGPEPDQVVLWHHLRIYLKVFRALASRDRGAGTLTEEAAGCAKLALVSVERSRNALRVLGRAARNEEIASLIGLLDTIEDGLEAAFPGARAFIRVGLDCPVA